MGRKVLRAGSGTPKSVRQRSREGEACMNLYLSKEFLDGYMTLIRIRNVPQRIYSGLEANEHSDSRTILPANARLW